ncbi:MAG: NosD domain-containing protein [Candidatus Bathyarchaeia archaeon]
MQKKLTLILLIFATLLLLTTCQIKPTKATTHTVNPGESIQDAINAASPGDTIYVRAGVYREYFRITKSLTLLGEDPKTTIIDGKQFAWIVLISADNVTFSGFTVQNGTPSMYTGQGISLSSRNNVTVSNNIIKDVANGIYFSACNNSKIFDNVITDCFNSGITFYSGYNNIIARNILTNNKRGFWFKEERFRDNIFYLNTLNNTNQFQVDALGSNSWDDGSVGNYWSNYRGIDANGDGVGDTPYEINPPFYDNKPLVVPPFGLPIFWQNKLHFITFKSGSTIIRPCYDPALKLLRFQVNGTVPSQGYCNLTIPNELFNTPYFILLGEDGTQINPDAIGAINATHTWLYFTYYHTLPSLKVTVVPEFSSPMLLPLLLLTVLIAAFVAKIRKGIG